MRRVGQVAAVLAAALGVAGFVAAASQAQTIVPTQVLDAGTNVAMTVPVQINGKAVPMTVDTGAQQTQLNAGVAKRLGLAKAGKPSKVTGVGCSSRTQPVAVPAWTLGSAPLGAATISTVKGFRGLAGSVGLLGNDVLQQFGTVSIDFADRRLVLGDPTTAFPFRLPSTALVFKATGAVANPVVRVTIRGKTLPFIPDTGASQSTMKASIAKRLGLETVGKPREIGAVGCKVKTSQVAVTRWSSGAVRLPPTLLRTTRDALPVAGLLGAPALSSFGQLSVTYAGADTTVALGFPAPSAPAAPAPTPSPDPSVTPSPTPVTEPTVAPTQSPAPPPGNDGA